MASRVGLWALHACLWCLSATPGSRPDSSWGASQAAEQHGHRAPGTPAVVSPPVGLALHLASELSQVGASIAMRLRKDPHPREEAEGDKPASSPQAEKDAQPGARNSKLAIGCWVTLERWPQACSSWFSPSQSESGAPGAVSSEGPGLAGQAALWARV